MIFNAVFQLEKKLIHKISSFEMLLRNEHCGDPVIDYRHFFSEEESEGFPGKTNARSLMGKFLIKKIVLEKLQTTDYRALEIKTDHFGKPYLKFSNEIAGLCHSKKVEQIQFSISHSKEWIAVLVVFEIKCE